MKNIWSALGKASLRFTLVVVLLLFVTSPVWSQGFQGTIRGSVQDPTGALIPGANVTVTNVSTGETRSQLTSSTGTFDFPNLLVSTYTVSVEMQGFKKYTRENVQVNANTVADVVARLEVGAITEEVSVTVGAERVQVSTAQLEGFTTRNIVELPNPMLSGRADNFAILAPGTTTMPGGMAGEGGSIGGNRPRQNNFVVDGVDNNSPSVTGALTPVIAEAVEQFTLLTNQFSAEYGHSTAGQFITTSKSGSNALHGRAWWYNQNRNTNSLDNVTRAVTKPGDPKPRYDWNRFGGQAGGPIISDKWFYFSSYEYQNLSRAGTSSGIILVPTAAGLSQLQSLASTPGTGISPITVGILAAHVPTASTQTSTRNVLNEATGAQVAIPLGQFTATTPSFDRTHLWHVNSDYQTARHRISGRYNHTRNPFVSAGPLPIAQFNSNASFNTHRVVFSDVFTVGPRVVNEFRAGYNRSITNFPVDLPGAPGTTDIFGNYSVTELSLGIGPSSNLPQSSVNNIYQFLNTTSVVFGGHTVKFGPEIRNIIAKSDFLPRARGDYVHPTLDSFVRDRYPGSTGIRGVGLGAFTQNRTAYYAFVQDNWKVHPRVTLDYGIRYEFTTIARDQRLQDLNGLANIVSVRDETFGDVGLVPTTDARFNQKIFDTLPAHHQQAILFHVGERLLFRQPNPDNNNFAPRIGIAWDVTGDGRTSLRAGVAIAHDVIFGNLPLLQLPPQIQAENRESNACTLAPAPAWCTVVPAGANPQTSDLVRHSTRGFLANGGLLPVLNPAARVNRLTARRLSANHVVGEEVSPETYTWSLSLQREQFQDWLFEARYVGTRGVHLPVQMWRNPGVPNPVRLPLFMNRNDASAANFTGARTLGDFQSGVGLLLAPYGFNGVLTTFAPDGQSWYHGGSISAEKRLSRGLQLTTNYTWSKTLDIIENELFTSLLNPRRPSYHYDIFANKGLSGMHREHKFVVSWLYDLPRMQSNGALSKIANGWQFNGMYIAESGQPITIISNVDVNGDVDSAGETAFFNPNGQENLGSAVDFVCRSAGVTTFASSAAGCGGAANVVGYVAQNANAQYVRAAAGMTTNLGRNTHIMPGINTWNVGLFKKTPFWGEDREIEFRIEMWNTFNHPNFTLGTGAVTGRTGPAQTLSGYAVPGGSQFLDKSVLSGGGGNAPFQRIIQWGAKIHF